MFWNKRRKKQIDEELAALSEDILLMRYANFVPMYCTYFGSFLKIFSLHGIMSAVFLGIVAAINAEAPQEPFFYVASASFYSIVSLLVVLTIFRLRNLIAVYSEELQAIERRIRIVNRKQRLGIRTSDIVFYLIVLIGFVVSCYMIAPAREEYAILRIIAPFLSLFDVPIDLSGLQVR